MKNFNDLVFKKHKVKLMFDQHAILDFDNGYSISVVNGEMAKSGSNTYEVAIMKHGSLVYDTGITDDVLAYQTEEEINEIIKKVESLEKKINAPMVVERTKRSITADTSPQPHRTDRT